MKLSKHLVAAVVGLATLPFTAHAQDCAGTPLNVNQISTLLAGKLLCGRPGTGFVGNASDRWQEEHVVGGDLFDFKRGPGHPVDPRVKVGTWFVGGSRAAPTVTHAYGPTTAYAWRIFGPTTNNPGVSVYQFCNPTRPVQQVRAYVRTISPTGCGGVFPP